MGLESCILVPHEKDPNVGNDSSPMNIVGTVVVEMGSPRQRWRI